MSDAKHTPGPWVVKFRNDHSCWISFGDAINGPHKQFDLPFDDLDPSDVADARLIATAPKLLARLIEVEKLLAAIEWTDYPVTDELEAVRLDIAEATGSQA